MKILSGNEEKEAIRFIDEAERLAKDSTCGRKRSGCVIVKGGKIIGKGFNSPPGNMDSQKRCSCIKNSYHQKITDKTCCVHAEQRAIMDALKNNSSSILGSRLYFIRLDENSMRVPSGNPYCTICSKMALDSGIAEFVLWHDTGITVYDTDEYNDLSFRFRG